jgi:hypothetical protein
MDLKKASSSFEALPFVVQLFKYLPKAVFK